MIVEFFNSIINEISQNEINWIDIASVGISAVSLIFAILVPVRIANRQNKIALFEKRLNVYSELMKVVRFSDWLSEYNIDNTNVINEFSMSRNTICIINQFCLFFNCSTSIDSSTSSFNNDISSAIKRNRLTVDTIPFLYGKKLGHQRESMEKDIDSIYRLLTVFITSLNTDSKNEINKNKNSFVLTIEEFLKKYETTLENLLKM